MFRSFCCKRGPVPDNRLQPIRGGNPGIAKAEVLKTGISFQSAGI